MEAREPEVSQAPLSLEYVEQVAAGKVFSGSSSLPRLLRYLAERALEEPGEPIKEFRIATEALGRGAGFDPRNDSVVRVTTARLRSKLDEYYSGEGAGDLVRLKVPKGSYRLVAEPASAPAWADETSEHAILASEAGAVSPRPKWALLFAAPVVVALGLGYWLGRTEAREDIKAVAPEVARFWGAFADTPGGVRVVFGNSPEWVTSYGRVLPEPTVDPDSEPDNWRSGVGEVQAIYRLASVSYPLGLHFHLKRAQLVDWDEVVDVHVVYLGGPAANPQVADLGVPANFVFEREPASAGEQYLIRNRAARPGEPAAYAADTPLTQDFGIIRLTRGFRSDRWTLLLAGITTFSTSAAAEVVVDPDSLGRIREILGQTLDDPLAPFECVVKVGVKNSVPYHSRVEACRPIADRPDGVAP
ncbi:MAG: hypothetical protein R2748_07870 [Bryobacterales bacterium]